MPVSNTEVRIPLPQETTGDGLAAMLAGARGAKPAAPSTAQRSPSPSARDDAAAAAPPPSPTTPAGLRSRSRPEGAPEQVERVDKALPKHHDPNTAANGRFTIDANGRVVPAAPMSDKEVAKSADPDEVSFAEDDAPAPKPTDKAEVTPEVKPEVKPETPSNEPPVTFTQGQRDYSIFDAEDVEVLKKLPNAAFNRLAQRFVDARNTRTELDKLKQEVASKPKEPVYLHEHPEGYVLQPQFTDLLTQADNAGKFVDFYKEALAKAAEGENFQYIDAQGRIATYDLKGRVNPQVSAALQVELIKYAQQQQQSQAQLNQYQARYKESVQSLGTQLKQIDEKLFPGFDVAKLPPEEKNIYDFAVNQLTPEPLRNSPQTPILAKAYVSFARLHAQHTKETGELRSENEKLKAELAALKKNPSPKAAQAAGDDLVLFSTDD